VPGLCNRRPRISRHFSGWHEPLSRRKVTVRPGRGLKGGSTRKGVCTSAQAVKPDCELGFESAITRRDGIYNYVATVDTFLPHMNDRAPDRPPPSAYTNVPRLKLRPRDERSCDATLAAPSPVYTGVYRAASPSTSFGLSLGSFLVPWRSDIDCQKL